MIEIEEQLLRDALNTLNSVKSGASDEAKIAQQVAERIGDYLKYREQRKPVAYVAAGIEDDIWVALTQYAGRNESEVYSRILSHAMKEGYHGTGVDRMRELGWEIKGLYFD
ncbi:hypothetical protein [Burkholderia cepacia]|uniref:hypothetical protein n=1 Tax=Burkholderia cepacia TaxID=292 RepID=UPI0029903915|nr:hypothetical protein [Burkholderia cepacia]MDW9243645.1 hypothetical protein [Burkholderia cepacia]